MINTERTRKAINIAYNAHMGQKDKAGLPYIFHPFHLAEQMETEEECIVALLHDVVEDTDVNFKELEGEFSSTVIDALKWLTHDKSVDYMEYIETLKKNKIAKKVKIADITHNSDFTRLDKVTQEDVLRNEKYRKALEILMK